MARNDIGERPADWRDDTLQDHPEPLVSRRGFIKAVVGAAVAGALVPGVIAQLAPVLAPGAVGGSAGGPVIRRDPQTNARIPITLDDLAGTAPVVVTAEWNFLPAVIYKVRKNILEASSAERGYNTALFAVQHPTESEHAILVYDGKCKHLGCTVGWNEGLGGSKDIADYNQDGLNDGRILCPCHQGQYDIYDLAKNVPGTPPPSPLNVVEFDVGSWTSEAGESFSNVVLGFAKHLQDSYKQALSVTPAVGLPKNIYAIRTAGWSS